MNYFFAHWCAGGRQSFLKVYLSQVVSMRTMEKVCIVAKKWRGRRWQSVAGVGGAAGSWRPQPAPSRRAGAMI